MPHSAETKAGTTYGVKERRDLGSFHEPRSSIVALTHFHGVSGIRSTNFVELTRTWSYPLGRPDIVGICNFQPDAIHFYNSQDHLEDKEKEFTFLPPTGHRTRYLQISLVQHHALSANRSAIPISSEKNESSK